jgi:hypothetical protein
MMSHLRFCKKSHHGAEHKKTLQTHIRVSAPTQICDMPEPNLLVILYDTFKMSVQWKFTTNMSQAQQQKICWLTDKFQGFSQVVEPLTKFKNHLLWYKILVGISILTININALCDDPRIW